MYGNGLLNCVTGLNPKLMLLIKLYNIYLAKKETPHFKHTFYMGILLPISRKRSVTVWALILRLWVPRVVLAIIVTQRNWFSSLNLRFYRSWRRVIRWWRHEFARSDIVPICQKRFLRRSITLAWHRNCWSITDGVMLACIILIALTLSTCVHFGIVNKQCVPFNFKVLKCFQANWILDKCFQ